MRSLMRVSALMDPPRFDGVVATKWTSALHDEGPDADGVQGPLPTGPDTLLTQCANTQGKWADRTPGA